MSNYLNEGHWYELDPNMKDILAYKEDEKGKSYLMFQVDPEGKIIYPTEEYFNDRAEVLGNNVSQERDAREKFHTQTRSGGWKPHDKRIVEDILKNDHIILIDGVPYIYAGGVYLEDKRGNKVKQLIRNRLFDECENANAVKRIYDLVVMHIGVNEIDFNEVNAYPKHWINFRNGMFDPKTMKLYPHKPEYLAVNQIPHNYNADSVYIGSTPYRFIKGLCPDPDDFEMVVQYLGFMFSCDTSIQKMLLIVGKESVGKSSLVRLVQYGLGIENYSNVSLQDLGRRFYATALEGKLANIEPDLPKTALGDVGMVKKLTGEDTIYIEHKGIDGYHFQSYARCLFGANQMPKTFDEDTFAYYRRLLIVTVKERGEYIPDLENKLKQEIDAFITMCVDGLHRAYENGLTISDNSKDAVNTLRKDSDTVQRFLDDICIIEPKAKIKRSEIWNNYKRFCSAREITAKTQQDFFSSIRLKGFNDNKAGGEWYFKGLKMVEFYNDKITDIDYAYEYGGDLKGAIS